MFTNKDCCSGRQDMFGMPNQGQMMNQGFFGGQMMGNPIIEPTITKCVEQDFYHEVPQE